MTLQIQKLLQPLNDIHHITVKIKSFQLLLLNHIYRHKYSVFTFTNNSYFLHQTISQLASMSAQSGYDISLTSGQLPTHLLDITER